MLPDPFAQSDKPSPVRRKNHRGKPTTISEKPLGAEKSSDPSEVPDLPYPPAEEILEKVRVLDPAPMLDALHQAGVRDPEIDAAITSYPTDLVLDRAIHAVTNVPPPSGITRAEDHEARNMVKVLGRDRILETLSLSTDSSAEALIRIMEDPTRVGESFALQCRDAGTTPANVMSMFRDYHVATAVAKASIAMPELVDDLREDSRSISASCPQCFGQKEVVIEKDGETFVVACGTCLGRGVIYTVGSEKARGMLLEIAGVRQKGGGTVVNVLQSNRTEPTSSRMPAMHEFSESTDLAIIDVTPKEK